MSIVSVSVLLISYQGINSDWKTYRYYIENCDGLGCTYFEPGYDLINFIGSKTIGFLLIQILLILGFVLCLKVTTQGNPNQLVTILIVISITIANLPLMLGAVRQSMALPLLLAAAYLFQGQRSLWALLAIGIAGAIHYSSLVAAIWYLIVWVLIGRQEKQSVSLALLKIFGLIGCTYIFLQILTRSGLGESIELIARIGLTGADTHFITTGSLGRDLLILIERIPIATVAIAIYVGSISSLSKAEKIFFLMYIAGTAFFISIFTFDRNIAGRVLATFRIADVLVIVLIVLMTLKKPLRKSALILSLTIAFLFIVLKSYMTMATVGFFDE